MVWVRVGVDIQNCMLYVIKNDVIKIINHTRELNKLCKQIRHK